MTIDFHDDRLPLAMRLDRAARLAWPPQQIAAISGWQVTASRDVTKRTNATHSWHFDHSLEVGSAIDQVEGWYRARGKPSLFQLTRWSQPECLDAVLQAAGYRRFDDSLVQTCPVDAFGALQTAAAAIDLELRPTARAMNALCDPRMAAEARRARAALFGRIRRPLAIAVADRDGVAVAAGLVVVDGPLAGIFAMRTQPPWRGQGIASAILQRLAAWAAAMGAQCLYLQVEEANQPARRLYRRHGFQTVYGYHYRQAAT